MTDVTIESIAIEITASADEADKALQRLSQSLATLKSAVSGGLEGTSKVAKSLKELAEGAKSFEGVNADKIRSVADALNSLKNIGQIPDLSNLAKAVKDISSAANSINGADMSTFAANMQSFVAAVQPLSSLQGMGDFSSAINALNKLPKVAQNLQGVNLGTFAQQMQQITAAIQPFTTQMQSLSTTFNGLPAPVQQAVTSLSNYGTAANNASENTSRLGKSLKLLNFTAMYFAIKKVVSVLGTFVNTSNEYVENLNLFNVTMGEGAEEALNFANRVNELMGIDVSQWIRNQGTFKQLVSGFGMVEEKALLVSKNMTQLGYDISSYFNISVEDAMTKLQSGIAGELEPLRRLGYALDAATLQQVAYNHGIEMNINNMTQAQKAQIRYIAIMEQSKNAMGDMARTIDSPANQLRILESRIETLKRAIGDSLMPVISAALPYVTAFVKLLGEGFRALAELLGFKVPEFDYSDLMQKSNEGIAESFDEATAASKRFKGTLASIDQLNIIGTNKESNGTGDFAGFDLDLELPSYDFLGNLKEETDKAYETLKKFWENVKPILEGVAAGIAAAFVINKVSDVITGVKNIASAFKSLNGSVTGKFVSSVVAAVAAFTGLRKIVKDLTVGKGSVPALAVGISAVVAAAGAFIAVGNPFGAVLTFLGAGLGALKGYLDGIKQNAEDNAMARITAAFENGVTPISEVADALERLSTGLTSSESDYLKRKESIQAISDRAKDAGTNIKEMISELKAMESVSPDVIENLKSQFEELAKASKEYIEESNNNFKLYILANQDMLQAQGYNVSSMVEIINQGTKNATESIEELTARANELSEKQLTITLNKDELLELESINTQLLQMSGVDVDFGVDISGAADVLENISKLKFETPAKAAENLNKAFGTVADAYAKLDEAKKGMLGQVDTLVGISDEQKTMLREAIEEIFDIKTTKLNEAFSAPMNRIIEQAKNVGATIESEIAQATAKGVSTGGLFNADFWKSVGGRSYEEINREKIAKEFGDYASYVENPLGQLYSAFAQEGLSQDVVDAMLSNGKDLGGDLVEGATWGVKEMSSGFNGAIKDVAIGGIDMFRSITKTHSPSQVYAELGGYLMDGLKLGITSGKSKVLSALDDVANAMLKKMEGLEFAVPVYSEEDVNRMYSGTLGGFYGAQTMPTAEHRGVDSQAIGEAGRALADNGTPINVDVKVQSYVELDGETIGQSVSNYQQRQLAYSNGR